MGVPLVDITGVAPDIRTNVAHAALFDNTVMLGVEIEAERATEIEHSSFWESCGDGSLRDGGREFKFAHPLKGADVVNALRDMEENFDGSEAVFNKRTGVHVHVDVRDMYTHDLLAFTTTYMLIEKVLFHYFGKIREANIYCLPMYCATDITENVGLLLTANKDTHKSTLAHSFKKYQALNLSTMFSLGTIEFRQHAGTANASVILNWINMILNMRSYALGSPLDNDELKEQINDPRNLISMILGDTANTVLSLYDNDDELRDDLKQGMRVARDSKYITHLLDTEEAMTPCESDDDDLYLQLHGSDD